MKICVIQREGIRYFNRFIELAQRDKLEVELRLEDKNGQIVNIDLTSALIEAYSQHPELGKISAESTGDIVSIKPVKPIRIRESKTVSPAYLSESKKEKDDILGKVRAAQRKAVEIREKKEAEIAEARAKRLADARQVKADKKAAESRLAESKKQKAESKKGASPVKPAAQQKKPDTSLAESRAPRAESKKAVAPAKPAKTQETAVKSGKQKAESKKPTSSANLTKTQESAIKKIGKLLAKTDKPAAESKKPSASAKPKPATAVKASAPAQQSLGFGTSVSKKAKPRG